MTKKTDADKGKPEDVEATEVEATEVEEVTEETVEEEAVDVEEEEYGAEADDDAYEQAETGSEAGASYQQRTFKDVPDYRQCTQELEDLKSKSSNNAKEQARITELEETLEQMDDLIAQIDMEDELTIINFGSEAFEELEEVSQEIIDKAAREGTFTTDMSNITEAVQDLDWDGFTENAGRWMKTKGTDFTKKHGVAAAAGVGAAAVGGIFALPFAVAGVKGAQMYRNKQKERRKLEQVDDAEIETELRGIKDKLETLRDTLKVADEKIPLEIQSLKKLGQARLDAYTKMSLYIGAANEKLRQVAETELADLKESVDQNPESVVEQERLEELSDAFNHLDQRITEMETSRAVFIHTTMSLKTLRDQYKQAHRKVRTHITQSYPQWCANAAQVAQTLNLSDLANTIQAADDFADKMIDQNMKTQETAQKQLESSSRRGTNDPEKVIKALERSTEHVKKLADMTRQGVQDEEQTRDRLRQAVDDHMRETGNLQQVKTDKLLGRADDVADRARALEHKGDEADSKKSFNAAGKGAKSGEKANKAKARATAPKKDNGPNGQPS